MASPEAPFPIASFGTALLFAERGAGHDPRMGGIEGENEEAGTPSSGMPAWIW